MHVDGVAFLHYVYVHVSRSYCHLSKSIILVITGVKWMQTDTQ